VNDEAFFGFWDLYAGMTYSALLLQPDRTYIHSFVLGSQSHWGTWSLENDAGFDFLRLTVTGAAPLVVQGPFGPQQIPWPAFEQWAITGVYQNMISLNGAMMQRRYVIPQAGSAPVVAGANTMTAKAMPAIDTAALSHYSAPAPAPPSQQSTLIAAQWNAAAAAMAKSTADTNAAIQAAEQGETQREFINNQIGIHNQRVATDQANRAFINYAKS
jgi:hypothetical protein